MIQEKLTAAYSYIRIWRAIAHTALVLGCLTALGWGLFTGGISLVAYFSQWGPKSIARQAQDTYKDECTKQIEEAPAQCEQNIRQVENENKEYAAKLPKRLEEIKQRHAQEMRQYQEDIEDYAARARNLTNEYNATAAIAESELKRLRNLHSDNIETLPLPIPNIINEEERNKFIGLVEQKKNLIAHYQRIIQESVMSEYAEYIAPVNSKINELQRAISNIEQQIKDVESDAERQIRDLQAEKKQTPTPTFEARPVQNIFGTINTDRLTDQYDASDALPILAARLQAEHPLTEDGRRNLRKSLLNLTDWLPSYFNTYRPTQADIDAVHAHNRTIDERINGIRNEMYNKTNQLRGELYNKQNELNKLTPRKENLAQLGNQLENFIRHAAEDWTISKTLPTLEQHLETPFPTQPGNLESQLQKEKDAVAQKDRESKQRIEQLKQGLPQKIQQLKQDIERSEEQLDATLAQLSDAERYAYMATLVPGFSMAGSILVATWLGFYVLLIIGDFMICPLVNATKAQEIAYNTRAKENN